MNIKATSAWRARTRLLSGLVALVSVSATAQLSAQTVWRGNFGNKTITSAGTYQIGPDNSGNPATGTIKIQHNSGTVILEGTGGVVRDLYTNGSVSNPSAVIEGTGSGSTTIRNIVVRNDGSFGITLRGGSSNSITNCKVLSQDDDFTQDGFGIANNGKGSMTNCVTKVSDDSYKLYGSGVSVSSSTAEQMGNGACLQYGWGTHSVGSGHNANAVTCKSNLISLSANASDTSNGNPGRAVVGWLNNDSGANNNVTATNLAINSPGSNWNHITNINFSGGATCTTLKVTGSFNSSNPTVRINGSGLRFSPIKVNIIGASSKIDGFTINFGGVFAGANPADGNGLVYINDRSKVVNRSIQ